MTHDWIASNEEREERMVMCGLDPQDELDPQDDRALTEGLPGRESGVPGISLLGTAAPADSGLVPDPSVSAPQREKAA